MLPLRADTSSFAIVVLAGAGKAPSSRNLTAQSNSAGARVPRVHVNTVAQWLTSFSDTYSRLAAQARQRDGRGGGYQRLLLSLPPAPPMQLMEHFPLCPTRHLPANANAGDQFFAVYGKVFKPSGRERAI